MNVIKRFLRMTSMPVRDLSRSSRNKHIRHDSGGARRGMPQDYDHRRKYRTVLFLAFWCRVRYIILARERSRYRSTIPDHVFMRMSRRPIQMTMTKQRSAWWGPRDLVLVCCALDFVSVRQPVSRVCVSMKSYESHFRLHKLLIFLQ